MTVNMINVVCPRCGKVNRINSELSIGYCLGCAYVIPMKKVKNNAAESPDGHRRESEKRSETSNNSDTDWLTDLLASRKESEQFQAPKTDLPNEYSDSGIDLLTINTLNRYEGDTIYEKRVSAENALINGEITTDEYYDFLRASDY